MTIVTAEIQAAVKERKGSVQSPKQVIVLVTPASAVTRGRGAGLPGYERQSR